MDQIEKNPKSVHLSFKQSHVLITLENCVILTLFICVLLLFIQEWSLKFADQRVLVNRDFEPLLASSLDLYNLPAIWQLNLKVMRHSLISFAYFILSWLISCHDLLFGPLCTAKQMFCVNLVKVLLILRLSKICSKLNFLFHDFSWNIILVNAFFSLRVNECFR